MSVDFVVFDPDVAPRDGKRFRAWYDEQVDWDIDSPDPAPSILIPPLKRWYDSMTAQFPDMVRTPSEDDGEIDYCFNKHFMYCSMRPAKSDHAWKLAKELAANLNLGTYDPMSDDERNNSCIVFPDGPLANDPSWLSRIFGKTKG
jgi:hypothetical protein